MRNVNDVLAYFMYSLYFVPNRQTERQTERQKNRQKDRQKDRKNDRKTDRNEYLTRWV